MRVEKIGNAILYLGDCREVLPEIGAVDALVTDPPYGVGLGDRKNNNRERRPYESFEDTPEYIEGVVVPAMGVALSKSTRALVTPGIRNMWSYPKPKHVGSIYYPAAAGCNAWGFSCWQPIFYYGADPHGGRGSLHDSFSSTEQAEQNGHPCPKPLRQMIWMVNRASLPNETVLDPFMGSGTTGAACANLGRKFIGIELEPKYFDLACERIAASQSQQRLFE